MSINLTDWLGDHLWALWLLMALLLAALELVRRDRTCLALAAAALLSAGLAAITRSAYGWPVLSFVVLGVVAVVLVRRRQAGSASADDASLSRP